MVWATSDSAPPPSTAIAELRASKLPVSAWLHPNWNPLTASPGVMALSKSEQYRRRSTCPTSMSRPDRRRSAGTGRSRSRWRRGPSRDQAGEPHENAE